MCGVLALWAGPSILAVGPLVGAGVACALAWRLTTAADRQLLQGGMSIRPTWLLKWATVACGVATIVLFAAVLYQGRLAALATCFAAGAAFLAAAWIFGVLHEDPLADVVSLAPDTSSSIPA